MMMSERRSSSGGGAVLPVAILLLAGLGCEAAAPELVAPGGLGAEHETVVVEARVRPADSALARELGWTGGVPGVEVRYREHGTGEWREGRTDSTGRLVLEGLPPALWHVYGGRLLEEAEAERLGGVRRAFGDGLYTRAGGGSAGDTTRLTLELAANRPKGLVISEFATGIVTVLQADVGGRRQAHYLEIYNNADRTIYLDGKLLADGTFLGFFPTTVSKCADSRAVRTDSTGLVTRKALRFPGSGTDHPIEPGEAVVIAGAALDHTKVHPGYPDLSDADFEVAGGVAADNARVPNMESAGLEGFRPRDLSAPDNLWFLAEPTDLRSRPIVYRDHLGQGYVRVPAERILDAVGAWYWWPENERDQFGEPCKPFIHRRFERYFTHHPSHSVFGTEFTSRSSLQRRILRREGGRAVLLNTNTSAVDFFFGQPRSPGWVPDKLAGGIGLR